MLDFTDKIEEMQDLQDEEEHNKKQTQGQEEDAFQKVTAEERLQAMMFPINWREARVDLNSLLLLDNYFGG